MKSKIKKIIDQQDNVMNLLDKISGDVQEIIRKREKPLHSR